MTRPATTKTPPRSQIAQLRKENAEIESKIARFRKENADLVRKVEYLMEELRWLEHAKATAARRRSWGNGYQQ